MGKGSFIIYDADLKGLDFLTEAQAGKLIKALAKYRLEGVAEKPGNNAAVNILFQQMLEHIAINEDKYKEICKKRSEAIKKRWDNEKNNPKAIQNNTNEYKSIEMNTSGYLYDNDNDNDNDIDNDIDIDNDACGAKRENKRKNYYGRKRPYAFEVEPSLDFEAFKRKSIGLKYEKNEKAI